jgi:PPOX class probable FMN-dependent enzyme
MTDPYQVLNVDELRQIIPLPSARIALKLFDHIDDYARAFIERAPLLFLATSDAAGNLDVSPKGDGPGFVAVEDAHTLLLPDRPGNHLAYGFLNILERPQVALIFVVPGATETLRVAGTAELTRDPALLARLGVKGKPAVLATRIRVRECFFHCGKAFIRGAVWRPDRWPTGAKANIGAQIAARLAGGADMAAAIEDNLAADYRDNLY